MQHTPSPSPTQYHLKVFSFAVARTVQGVAYPSENSVQANFLELRYGEVRLVPSPMGENFSGSCTVTSRNPLIHIGATPATKSECFDPKGVQQGLLSWGWRCVEESLATANFREFFLCEVRRIPFHALR